MEYDLQNESEEKMQPKLNKRWFICNFKEQHSTVTSRQPDQHNKQKCIGTIKKNKKQKIGLDIIVN